MDVSIIILNYKSKDLVLNCIKSIKDSNWGNLKREIIVVDNNSQDNIYDELSLQYPEVIFIKNNKNIGMGAGNNIGIKKALGDYIVIMNPDTIALKNTFLILYDFMEKNPEVGIVGPKQYYPDYAVQDSCYRWHSFLTPLFRRTPLQNFKFAQKDLNRFLMNDFKKDTIVEVDWLLGSFLFCRSSGLKKVGLFDERFFLYFEDTDLCRRFWQAGKKIVYNPEAEIIHNHHRASAQEPWYKFFSNRATREHIKSWVKYLWKWK